MKALIDGDIIPYEFGAATDGNGKPLPYPLVLARVNSRLSGILRATEADSYQIYLTSADKSNYRFECATIKPYKGHRPAEKPFYWELIRNYLLEHKGAEEVHGMEADDKLGIEQCKADYGTTVICSRDKDLKMIPGWHYIWPAGNQKEELFEQSEDDGIKFFYKQLLTGDAVDNILGLFGVGKSSSLLKRVDECSTELEMFQVVQEQYEKRFGSYWYQFLAENATLLWIKRTEEKEERWITLATQMETMTDTDQKDGATKTK